jgi:hypothetical protein
MGLSLLATAPRRPEILGNQCHPLDADSLVGVALAGYSHMPRFPK